MRAPFPHWSQRMDRAYHIGPRPMTRDVQFARMRHVIVGTAGHIDHGKTSLVRALTGIDADRLKEEKQRGITIDIGFAHLEKHGIQLGFVDVPGHERFVKNMLAGVHGIDLVILVIAADESVMPQTREHFDICRLLGVTAGIVALTKIDMVEPELLDLARAEIEDYVAGSFLEGAPIVGVSSSTGKGIEELTETLFRLAAAVPARSPDQPFRLPVDRAFTVKGFGTVLTGTLISGSVRVGDALELVPGGRKVKVRGLQVHGEAAPSAEVAQRTAVNLQGVELEEVNRGHVLAPVGRFHETSMLDVRLNLVESAPRPVEHRTRVRFHHGTNEVIARVALLGRESVAAGESALVQMRLESPILALPGDRFIIRTYSPQVTIGGGIVLDALAQKHRRADARALEWLTAIETADAHERIRLRLARAAGRGLSLAELAAQTGMTDDEIRGAAEALCARGVAREVSDQQLRWIDSGAVERLCERSIDAVKAFHKREPIAPGIPLEELRGAVFPRLPVEVFKAIVGMQIAAGRFERDRDVLRLAGRGTGLTAEDEAAKAKCEEVVRGSGLEALTLAEVIGRAGVADAKARKFTDLLSREGKLVRLGDLLYHAAVLDDLKQRVRDRSAIDRTLDIAAFRDLTGGLSRKFTIPLLEWLDRERVTRRVGDTREIL